MSSSEWYSLSEASLRAGKSRAYFSSIKANHPEYFKNVEIKKIGRYLVINDEGVKEVLMQVKNADDRLRRMILKAVYKTKNPLCFYPRKLLYQKNFLLEV